MDELVGKYSYDSEGNPRLVGYYTDEENPMVDNLGDDCPLVKLAVAILDDKHGITTDAWEALVEVFKQRYGTRPPPQKVQQIMASIDGCDDRVYLPEGWQTLGIKIPVIGTLKENGQVEFNPERPFALTLEWTAEDVLTEAEKLGMSITKEEASQLLEENADELAEIEGEAVREALSNLILEEDFEGEEDHG
jgi:hypothetical protein